MHCTLPEGHGLLAPISSESPTGSDLRNADLFLQTRDIRNSARDNERLRSQGIAFEQSRLLAQWQQVADQCTDILATHSKDLDVCAWFIEAQTRLHGAQGLAETLTLYCELVQRYWHDIFPRPEINADATEAVAACVAAINGLNGSRRAGSVVEAINNFSITCSHHNERRDFLLWQFHAAQDAQHIIDHTRRQQRVASLGYSLQDIQQAADDTTTEFYHRELVRVESAQMALHRLDAVLTQKLGTSAPATALMRDALGSMHDAISHLAGVRLCMDRRTEPERSACDPKAIAQLSFEAAGTTSFHNAPARAVMSSHVPDSTSLSGRDEAIRHLASIADYFRQAEPHSPLAYSIDMLVRRARMPFDQLMRELIPDTSSRDIFQLMTGVPLAETGNP